MNDERLARRAAAGDAAAFEGIFRRYHQDLYRYCLATVGNPQDAQDALQNTMVKAMQSLPGERREIKLKPWLYRVARNEAIETLRRRREGVQLDAEREVSSGEITESAAARERLRQLFADLEELPERQRSALVMRELGGLGFEEIGASFDTSPAVVRQTLYEARLSLRQMDEGREMSCEKVMRALSDADGRVARRRDLRAHLRRCASCRDFREDMAERRGEFAAISPLPLALSAGLLQSLAGSQVSALGAGGAGAATASGAGGGGLAGAVGAGVGKTIAGATIAKSAATVAVVAAVGVSAADRGGVIDLPLGGGETTEAGPALERRSPVANEVSADPVAPGRQVSPGRSAETGWRSRPQRPKGSTSPAIGRPSAAGKAKRVEADGRGSPALPATPGRSQTAPAGSQPQTNPGDGRSPVAGQGEPPQTPPGPPQTPPGPPQNPPPRSSRGQEKAAAHKPPQATGKTSPAPRPEKAPKPEKPAKSEDATLAPAPPATEAPEAGKGSSAAKGGAAGKGEPTEP